MASTAAPFGARPVKLLGGQPYSNSFTLYPIASGYSTAIFNGDFVKQVVGGKVEKDTGTATNTGCVGIFVGCQYTDPNLGYFVTRQYWPASTVASDAYAMVVDDPDIIFEMQADGSLSQNAVGTNVAVVQTAGSTLSGNSANAVDASEINTTNTLPLRIVSIVDRPDNAAGDSYTNVLCKFNTHQHRAILGISAT